MRLFIYCLLEQIIKGISIYHNLYRSKIKIDFLPTKAEHHEAHASSLYRSWNENSSCCFQLWCVQAYQTYMWYRSRMKHAPLEWLSTKDFAVWSCCDWREIIIDPSKNSLKFKTIKHVAACPVKICAFEVETIAIWFVDVLQQLVCKKLQKLEFQPVNQLNAWILLQTSKVKFKFYAKRRLLFKF